MPVDWVGASLYLGLGPLRSASEARSCLVGSRMKIYKLSGNVDPQKCVPLGNDRTSRQDVISNPI